MWTVTSDYVKGILTYFAENKVTGERRGMFDCQPYVEEFARELNREEIDGIKRTDRKDLGTI